MTGVPTVKPGSPTAMTGRAQLSSKPKETKEIRKNNFLVIIILLLKTKNKTETYPGYEPKYLLFSTGVFDLHL
jgi:hypothetical protein